MKDTVILLSGGLDSTVLAYLFRARLGLAVFARYGQRHFLREWTAARAIAAKLDVKLLEIDLAGIYAATEIQGGQSNLLVRSDIIPSKRLVGEATIVPNRNMLLIAAAAALGSVRGLRVIAYGATATDHSIYPDCRPPFVRSMQEVLQVATEPAVELIAPFEKLAKAEVVQIGREHRVPFDLTWSCYQSGERHCGICGACLERRKAFAIAGAGDPTLYRAVCATEPEK